MADTALITGSYGGLGSCFADIHAAEHGDLILVGRSQAKLDRQAEEMKKRYGVAAHTIAADLSAPTAAQHIYDTCKENGWQPDIIINNALWRELQGTGVTVTALMPVAMRTGFASRGGLSDTKLFANAVDPLKVAEDGYNGMLRGELHVISGLPGWQKPFMNMAPMLPKKTMLNFVYSRQTAGSAGK